MTSQATLLAVSRLERSRRSTRCTLAEACRSSCLRCLVQALVTALTLPRMSSAIDSLAYSSVSSGELVGSSSVISPFRTSEPLPRSV